LTPPENGITCSYLFQYGMNVPTWNKRNVPQEALAV
jgi:hypothetical protein